MGHGVGMADGWIYTIERAEKKDNGRGRQPSYKAAELAVGAAVHYDFVPSRWCDRAGDLDTAMFAGLE